jgi:hypothetical protein
MPGSGVPPCGMPGGEYGGGIGSPCCGIGGGPCGICGGAGGGLAMFISALVMLLRWASIWGG